MITVSVPLLIGNAIYEINDIVDRQISTGLAAGNASCLTYGGTINNMVSSLIVTSVSIVLFSHFASLVAEGKIKTLEKELKKALEYLSVLIFPIMAMCIFAGDQIVSLLFERGNFGENEVSLAYGAVLGYSLGFVFQTARVNISKVYYAFQDTKTPMVNGAICVSVNIGLSIWLSKYYGIAGIAFATSVAACLATLLLGGIRKYLPEFSVKESLKENLKGLFAAVLASLAIVLTRRLTGEARLVSLLLEGAACLTVYLAAMMAVGSSTMRDIRTRLVKN